MAALGNWKVGVQLKFTSNASTEIKEINKALKMLREGEILKTQQAFKMLGDQMLTLGKKMDSSGNIQRNTFNSLSKGLTKITDQTKAATSATQQYATAIQGLRMPRSGGGGSSRGSGSSGQTYTGSTIQNLIPGASPATGGQGTPPGGGNWGRFARGFGAAQSATGGFASGLLMPSMMMGGMNPMLIGMAVRDGVASAINTGAGYQQYLNVAANMGDMNSKQKARWAQTMLGVSSSSGINPVDVMHSSLDIVRLMKGTMTNEDMASMAPKLFQAAKVLQVTRGYDPAKSIDNIVEITHMLHDYSPKRMNNMMDLMLGSSELISQDPSKLKTQMGYFASAFKNAKVSDEDIFASIVMSARAGGGQGKGGTSLANFLASILGQADITSFRAQMREKSIQNIIGGNADKFYYADKPGGEKTMHIMDIIDNIAKYAQAHPGWKIVPELSKAFGVQGSRFASFMADPEAVKAFRGTRKALDDPNMTVQRLYGSVMNNYATQSGRAGNSFSVLGASLTPQLMPSLTNVARSFADMMNDLSNVLGKNPHLLDGVRHFLDGMANAFVHIGKAVQSNPQLVSKFFDVLGKSIVGFFGIMATVSVAQIAMNLFFLGRAIGLIGVAFRALPLAFLLGNPIGIAVTLAISALTAGLLFPKKMHEIGEGIVGAVSYMLHGLGDAYHNFTMNPGKAAKNAGQSFDNISQWMWNHIGPGLFHGTSPQAVPKTRVQGTHGTHTKSGHSGDHKVAMTLNVYGNVYGHDLDKHILNLMEKGSKHPMSTLGTNLNNTSRTHANIPQFMSVATA